LFVEFVIIFIFVIIIIVLFIVFIIGKMIIQALPEIPTEGLTLDDVDELMERTRKVMSETFESLVTEVSRQ
jgi:predicted PurR-regulated permease PerM